MAATTAFTFSPDDFKVRWREPYVSAALNRKFAGIIPRGIYRGFVLEPAVAALTVQLGLGSAAEHLAIYETTDAYSLTIRRSGILPVSVAAYAGQTVYIALYATYSPTVLTAATIRVYSAADYAIAPEKPELVVIGRVNVPGAGVIPATDISVEDRVVPWGSLDAALTVWPQLVANSGFEEGQGSGGGVFDSIQGWTYEIVAGAPALAVSTAAPHTGARALNVVLSGPADRVKMGATGFVVSELFDAPLVPVREGQLVHASFWVAGTTIPVFTDGTGGVALIAQFFDDAGAVLATYRLGSDSATASGTFAYKRYSGITSAPADCFLKWSLEVRADLAGGPGTYNIDEVLVHIAPDGAKVDELSGQPDHTGSALASKRFVLPPAGVSTLQDQIDKSLWLRNFGVQLGAVTAALYAADGTDARLGVAKLAASKTVELFSTDPDLAKVSAGTAAAVNAFFLVEEFLAAPGIYARVYTENTAAGGGWFVTMNAKWDTGSSLWLADNTAGPAAVKFGVTSEFGIRNVCRDAGTLVGGWADTAWNGFSAVTLRSDSNDAATPLLDTTKQASDHPTPNLWKELFAFPCGGTPTFYLRMYSGQYVFGQFCITLNARFDPAPLGPSGQKWHADDTTLCAVQLSMFLFPPATSGLLLNGKAVTTVPWPDVSGAWDTSGSGSLAQFLALGRITSLDDIASGGDFTYTAPITRQILVGPFDLIPIKNNGAYIADGVGGWVRVNGAGPLPDYWESQVGTAYLGYEIKIPSNYVLKRVRVLVENASGLDVFLYRISGVSITIGGEVAGTQVQQDTDNAVGGSLQVCPLVASAFPNDSVSNSSGWWHLLIRSSAAGQQVLAAWVEFEDEGPRNSRM